MMLPVLTVHLNSMAIKGFFSAAVLQVRLLFELLLFVKIFDAEHLFNRALLSLAHSHHIGSSPYVSITASA